MRGDARNGCDCKIGRISHRYEFGHLDEELERRRREEEASLRDLATYINHRVLEAALETSSDGVFETDLELFGALGRKEAIAAIYSALADGDTPPERQARVRTRLEQIGIDIDVVERDWVTHPTVRSHLRRCLDIDTSPARQIDPGSASDTIEWARSRCVGVIDRTLERLQTAGQLSIADVDVSVSVRITCTQCQESYTPTQLISQRKCTCYRDDGRPSSTT